MSLEDMLEDSYNILLLDNLNIDLKTFDPQAFQKLKKTAQYLDVDRISILGNLFSFLGDEPAHGRNRTYVSSNAKRVIEEGSEFEGQRLYELEEKIKYATELLSDINIPIDYTLGSHDKELIKYRQEQEINKILNKFEQNMLSMLGDVAGQNKYFQQFILNNYEELQNNYEEMSETKFNKWFKQSLEEHSKEFFGEEPVEKLTAKSDLSPERRDNISQHAREKYLNQLSKIPNLNVRDYMWEEEFGDNIIRFGYDLSGMTRPGKTGFGSMRLSAVNELRSQGYLPNIMIQGRHGVMQADALRYGDHDYTHLIQVPAFEDREQGLKLVGDHTANLETTVRQKKVPVPEGALILSIKDTGRVGYLWVDKELFGQELKQPMVSKASVQDVQLGHGVTYQKIFENALKRILVENPDVLNLGGDLIQGGHYDSYPVEKSMIDPNQMSKDMYGLSREEMQRYLEKFNTPYHTQLNTTNNILRDFLLEYINNGGDKTIFLNDGHHSRYMTGRDMILSYSQMIGHNLISSLEAYNKFTGNEGVYEENIEGFEYKSMTPEGSLRMKYAKNEIFDEINGVKFNRTHHRKARGGKKFSQLRGIIDYANDRLVDSNIFESEHYHKFELGIFNHYNGAGISVLHPAFQGTTDYAKGHTYSRGSFLDSVIGYTNMLISPGTYYIEPVLSNVLKDGEE